MGKKWVKNYLLLGIILMAVLSAVCSFTFVKNNIQQNQDKRTFESIYTDTSIDFIVPSPSYGQISEIESDSETGIKAITPFYETTTAIDVGGSTARGTTIIIPDEKKIQYTPYCASRIVSGRNDVVAGDAIVDRIFEANNNCKIGDIVSLTIANHAYTFEIRGISETNTYYNDGTIAVILSESQAIELKNGGIKYSAAYVSADDYEKCKAYLYNVYKPYGRLKDASEFENKDAYDQHAQNFETADWTKEITNCKDNYSSLSVKYENVESGIYRNMIIAAIIVFMAVIIFNSVLLRHESFRKFFQSFLIKQSGTKAAIKSFYKNGIVVNAVLFCAVTIAIYCWIASESGIKIFGMEALTSIVMMAVQIIASVLMIFISSGYIEKNYTIKKKKTPEEAGQQKNDDSIEVEQNNEKPEDPAEVSEDTNSIKQPEGNNEG